MSKLKTYRVIVGKRDEVWTNESHEVKAKNMRIAKVIAKCRVPAYWNPIVREIAIMH